MNVKTAMPNAGQILLLGTVLLAGMVSLPQEFDVGPVTGLGAASAAICCASWLLWFARPRLNRIHLPVLLPLMMFALYAAGSLLWFQVSVKGLQLLCVLLAFVGLTVLATREVEENPGFARVLNRALDAVTWFATALYAVSIARDGLGAETIILARPYALFVLIGLARQLAIWQAGDNRGLVGAGIICAVVLASISRTALAAALVMVPLAALVRGRPKDVAFAVGGVGAGALTLAAALTFSQTIYDRFFGYDSTMQVGGVWVNSSGRTAMWTLIWEHALKEPILGQGVGSSALLIDVYFPGLGHPHNDFLRIFYDFGGIGLALWLAFHAGALLTLLARARRAGRTDDRNYPFHLVAFLGLVALIPAMFTDNPISYAFVMMPLGVMVGVSLGRTAAAQSNEPAPTSGAPRQSPFAARRSFISRRRQPRRSEKVVTTT